jgi:hypothetical protein
VRSILFLSLSVLSACGGAKPRPAAPAPVVAAAEQRPDWAGRSSGIFQGARGSSLIEGISSGKSAGQADSAACKEAERILRERLVALLPATQSAQSLPPLKLEEASVLSRYDDGRRVLSLCVIDRDGVKRAIGRVFSGGQREYMLVQLEQILPSK